MFGNIKHTPTPEEIVAKCAEIRNGWTERVRAKRCVLGRDGAKVKHTPRETSGRVMRKIIGGFH